MAINQLPAVDRIQGAVLVKRSTPKSSQVELQYTDQQGQWHQTVLPFLDAMYLMNLLKAMQLDSGFQMPDDPRLPPETTH